MAQAIESYSNLPRVGDRVKIDYGLHNVNTWKYAGKVLAVIPSSDDSTRLIVIERLTNSRRRVWEIVMAEQWMTGAYRLVRR